MSKKNRTGPTAAQFVEVTVSFIAEKGSSQGVNLREVSRRIGCAHTNVYNYYGSFQDLLWAAFAHTLELYGEYLVHDLDDSLSSFEYFRRVIVNLATFPLDNPGLYRFIGSDTFGAAEFPKDIIEAASRMKRWLFDVVSVLCGPRLDRSGSEAVAHMLLAYIDGEAFNTINGRVLPGEDVQGRVVGNTLRLFTLLTATKCNGIDLQREDGGQHRPAFPKLAIRVTGGLE